MIGTQPLSEKVEYKKFGRFGAFSLEMRRSLHMSMYVIGSEDFGRNK